MTLPSRHQLQHTSYTSRAVTLPDNFLTTLAPDSQPITTNTIDFATSPLPRYTNHYAVIIDHVLSESDCRTLLSLAEQSAPDPEQPWQPALVNAGPGVEVRADDYRKSDRIIWDCAEIVDRVVARCFAANDGAVGRELAEVSKAAGNADTVLGERAAERGQAWAFTRGNERLRFLKYGSGCFFARHSDGSYESLENKQESKPFERTLFTLHLYLNGEGVEGGETTFWDRRWGGDGGKGEARVDVKAEMGRVLIFQHRGLVHSGEEVRRGVKFTVRTDLLYRRVDGEVEGRE